MSSETSDRRADSSRLPLSPAAHFEPTEQNEPTELNESTEQNEPTELDEAAKRRKRTVGYLNLWGLDVDLSPLPIPTGETHVTRDIVEVVGRAKALCLLALKGQGLSMRESFAFADAYEVWEHLTVAENDFVLEHEPPAEDLVQFAWRFEGLRVMEWALGLVKHLSFPIDVADPAKATELCIQKILAPDVGTTLELRTPKELFDAADVTFSLSVIAAAISGNPVSPVALHPGIVHERMSAFQWLVPTLP
jgi:hypothetical protein